MFVFFQQKTAYEWRIIDWSSDVCSSDLLAAADDIRTVLAVLSDAVVRFNSLPPEAARAHRQRMSLILHVPALQAHSNLRYAAWRAVVAEYVARRTGAGPEDALPPLVGHVALGAAVASYERWLADESSDLSSLMAQNGRAHV